LLHAQFNEEREQFLAVWGTLKALLHQGQGTGFALLEHEIQRGCVQTTRFHLVARSLLFLDCRYSSCSPHDELLVS
jgi:hypothetical protein